jgi:hypothetical protein
MYLVEIHKVSEGVYADLTSKPYKFCQFPSNLVLANRVDIRYVAQSAK